MPVTISYVNEVPLSLYLKLKQGRHADLEVVSKASLSFVALVREIAADIDPDIELSVEILSGTEGSLGINTLARLREAARKANETADIIVDGLKRRRIHWLALYVAFRIVNNAVDWTQDQVMDWLAGDDVPVAVHQLSDEDRRAIAADIVMQLRHDIAKKPVQSLYRELERDHKIEAVGVTYAPKQVPATLVPRSDFSRYADSTAVTEGQSRVVTSRVGATLISPVLMTGNRRWKFRGAAGEFGAPMRDAAFLQSALDGSLGIPMQAGVALDMDLETRELYSRGVWEIEGYSITKVHGWAAAPVQPDFLAAPPRSIADSEQSDEQDD